MRYRDFALFWVGAFVSSIGMWMQNVTVPFLLHEATGSAAWVGLGAFAQFAPAMVMSPLGGSLADRHSRRTILLWSQAVSMVLAFALWLAVRDGADPARADRGPGGLTGIVTGLAIPAWQSFVAELVPRAVLLNAVPSTRPSSTPPGPSASCWAAWRCTRWAPACRSSPTACRSWRCWAPLAAIRPRERDRPGDETGAGGGAGDVPARPGLRAPASRPAAGRVHAAGS